MSSRFYRWRKAGVFDRVLQRLQAQADAALAALSQPCGELQRIVADARLQPDDPVAALRGTQARDAPAGIDPAAAPLPAPAALTSHRNDRH